MSTGAFSIDQLMELAGLSVSQAGTWVTKRPSRKHLTGILAQSTGFIQSPADPEFLLPLAQETTVSWSLCVLFGSSGAGPCANRTLQGATVWWLRDTFATMVISQPSTTPNGARMNCTRFVNSPFTSPPSAAKTRCTLQFHPICICLTLIKTMSKKAR